MDINLKNHVLILDEAHNIEDSSREGASCTFTQEEIADAMLHVEQRERKKEDCKKLVSNCWFVVCLLYSTLLSIFY